MEIHHKRGPVRNWREFSKEVGIIVLGVVIALGGEQAVEAIHHRSEVRDTREALRGEVRWDLGAFQITLDHAACALQRVAEIERWDKSWDSGKPLALARPFPRLLFPETHTAIWSVSSEAVARMPLDERSHYAAFYDTVQRNNVVREDLRSAWLDLKLYENARRLSDDQHLRIAKDIATIRDQLALLASNFEDFHKDAAAFGIAPPHTLGPTAYVREQNAEFCKPILAS
jgi:hypothetical protein